MNGGLRNRVAWGEQIAGFGLGFGGAVVHRTFDPQICSICAVQQLRSPEYSSIKGSSCQAYLMETSAVAFLYCNIRRGYGTTVGVRGSGGTRDLRVRDPSSAAPPIKPPSPANHKVVSFAISI